ncbi:MAG: hypothetical protein REI09_04195 [Candidatus Dactylopiibacterium sp.]|nr:hypothetical protein [Candidatus Dactylopiibacterium sp.]
MAEFEDQQGNALQISGELARCLVALRVDWRDDGAMRALAREALAFDPGSVSQPVDPSDVETHARRKFFGLIALMLRTMEESADEGFLVHGTDVWKAVARALWAEKGDAP